MDFILFGTFVLLVCLLLLFLLSTCLCALVWMCSANEPRLFTSFRIHEFFPYTDSDRTRHTPAMACDVGRALERRACTNCRMRLCACDWYIQQTNMCAIFEVATTKETMTRHSVRTANDVVVYLFIYIHGVGGPIVCEVLPRIAKYGRDTYYVLNGECEWVMLFTSTSMKSGFLYTLICCLCVCVRILCVCVSTILCFIYIR